MGHSVMYHSLHQGAETILGFRPTTMGNSMLKLGRPIGGLNFNMGLPIPVGRNPNIVTPPRFHRIPSIVSILEFLPTGTGDPPC